MAAASYGAYQPGAVDPWPIESVALQEALKGNPDAQGWLSVYQHQRQAQGNVYGQEAEKQHAFAKDQLIAQMTEARNKLIPEIIGKPGGGEFLAGGGIQGIGPGDGGNASAWAGLGTAGHQYDFAKNLAEEGKAVESFSRAGQDLPLQQIPGLQNFQTTGAGKHSDITVQELKNENAQQLAAMKAKNAGAGGTGTGFGVGFDVPNAYGSTDHVTANKKVSDAQIDAYRRSRGMLPIDPAKPAQPPPSGSKGTPAPTERVPGLAPQGSGTGPAGLPANSAARVAAAQAAILSRQDEFRAHPQYPDMVAGMKANGGKPIIKPDPATGELVLYGGSGRPLRSERPTR